MTVYTYDDSSNLILFTNSEEGVTKYIYNKYNQLTKIEYPDSLTAVCEYDKSGRLTKSKDKAFSIINKAANTTIGALGKVKIEVRKIFKKIGFQLSNLVYKADVKISNHAVRSLNKAGNFINKSYKNSTGYLSKKLPKTSNIIGNTFSKGKNFVENRIHELDFMSDKASYAVSNKVSNKEVASVVKDTLDDILYGEEINYESVINNFAKYRAYGKLGEWTYLTVPIIPAAL